MHEICDACARLVHCVLLAAVGAGRTELAHRELHHLAESCRLGLRGDWEFNEWLHGQTARPMGKLHQAWSAASYVRAHHALRHPDEPAGFRSLEELALD